MKKIIAIVFTLVSISVYGQEKFSSEAMDKELEKIISFKYKYEAMGNKVWAKSLSKEFPLDDNGSIKHEYIISYPDSLSIEEIMDKTVQWTNYQFSSTNAIQSISRESGSEAIVISTTLGSIAQVSVVDIFYAKTAKILADIDIIIRFKEGRLKITSIVRHYTYISGDSLMVGKNKLVAPNCAYPFGENKDIKGLADKNLCSTAFINATAETIGMCVEYKAYLNKEFGKETEEDW